MTNGVSLPLPWHNKANYESEVVKMYEPKDIQNLNVSELMKKINREIHSRYTDEELYKICGLPIPQPKPRFEKIKDSMGTWMHDNQTGIDYSCEIGLRLIDSN